MVFNLFTAEGDKYDHRNDPDDITGLCEADPELRKQLEQLGYVVRWAIDGRYRLTEAGRREKAKRLEEINLAKKQGLVGKLLPEHEIKGEHNE